MFDRRRLAGSDLRRRLAAPALRRRLRLRLRGSLSVTSIC